MNISITSGSPAQITTGVIQGVVTDSTEIVTFSRNGQFPSDHFPVVARIRFMDAK